MVLRNKQAAVYYTSFASWALLGIERSIMKRGMYPA